MDPQLIPLIGLIAVALLELLFLLVSQERRSGKLKADRKKEWDYQKIVECAEEGVWILDREGRILYANKKMVSFLGRAKEEMIGRRPVDFTDGSNSENLKKAWQRRRRGENEQYDLKFIKKDESEEWGLLTVNPLFEKDHFSGALCMVTDISDRKRAENKKRQSEEKYRFLFENMSDGVSIYEAHGDEPDFIFFDFNTASERMFNIAKEDVVGRKVQEVFPTVEQFGLLNVFKRVWRTGEAENYPLTIYKDERITRWMENFVYKLPSGQLVAIYSDETGRKQVEEERKHLIRDLAERNKELQEMIYVVSHDLRSPLVNIQGFSQELERSCGLIQTRLKNEGLLEKLGEDFARTVQSDVSSEIKYIQAGVQKMSRLLDGMLRLARYGHMRTAIQPQNMNVLLKKIISGMTVILQQENADIQVEDLPPCLGDEVLLDQIFSNLLNNALKYGDPERRNRIQVTGQRRNGEAVYCVSDEGMGIAPEYQKKIFEIFHRLEPARKVEGEGLGLTIVQRSVSRLNGQLQLESELGKGSRFTVILPAAD